MAKYGGGAADPAWVSGDYRRRGGSAASIAAGVRVMYSRRVRFTIREPWSAFLPNIGG